ncbi:MAG: type 2 lanthipeptide synthetase LanM, partial [Spirulina sp.]
MQFTDTDLAAIVADASFLWERLNSDRFTVDPDRIDRSEIDRRCDRWCQTVSHEGKGEILQKRLQWEGLNLEDLRPCLGKVRLAAGENLPTWAETLRQIVRTAAAFDSNAAMPWPTKANQPVPFEDIWLPAIQVARQNLLIRLGTAANLPLSLLSAQARTSLERSLLQRLSLLSAKTLDLEFSKARTFGQNLLNLLGIEAETGKSKTQYHQFVKRLLEDGLFGFLHTYPVLGRFIAVAVNFWVEATAEFIQRLASDRAEIQQVFNLENREKSPLGKVSEIETSLSDPHNQGRTVILLTFESGLKLVYKPKDLGLEVAWNQFLAWCNQQSQPLDLKVIQVFDRDGYGWVEYVEHQPCRDETAIERFYQRAGMLLCLIYVLRGNDCHYENLIASGEHLVLIDMETLLHHDPQVLDDSPEFPAFETESTRLFWDSVLRTGMLPRWDFGPDRRVAYDISGLGRTDPQQAPQKIQRWQAINTDEMHLRAETVTLPIQKNVPLLGDSPLSPNDYQVQIVAGFEQMYR